MIIKNEADRYLSRVLASILPYVDALFVVDDASTDATVELVQDLASTARVPLRLRALPVSLFAEEHRLRRLQWDQALSFNPDHVLVLDADEELHDFVRPPVGAAGTCRLYDMWSETHYREDPHWEAHRDHHLFLVPVPASAPERLSDDFPQQGQHCGRFPRAYRRPDRWQAVGRIQHWGWAKLEDRQAKVERYLTLDKKLDGNPAQYASILDPNPTLIRWKATPTSFSRG